MEPSTSRGVAFLLSLGTLPIACQDDERTTGSGAATTATTVTTATTATTATTDDPTGGTTGDEGTGTGAATGSGAASSGSGDPTGEPLGPCEAYVAWGVMCDPALAGMEPALLADCEAQRTSQMVSKGAACAALFDEYLLCLGGTTCDNPMACEAEAMAAYGCSPEVGPICMSFAAKYAECMLGDLAGTAKYCQSGLNVAVEMYGPACGTAHEELYVCLTALPCADLEMGTGCDAQRAAVNASCG